jgi:hypothetical protein
MGARLFVSGDSSFNGNMYVIGRTILKGDVSTNSRLFVNGDVSMNSRLFVNSDVSLNARLFVSGDSSFNGNMYTLGRTIHQGDVSINSRLFISGDASMNARLFVYSTQPSNSYTNGALTVAGGAGIVGNLNVGGNANFMGLTTAVTMPNGTANTSVATTEFVITSSGFLKNKIYVGSETYVAVEDFGVGNMSVVVDGTTVATASKDGLNLASGATAATQSDSYNSAGNASVATTQFVKTATQWWGGSAKFVSNQPPNPGVNDNGSRDGDFWFQYI